MKIIFLIKGLGEYAQACAVGKMLVNSNEDAIFITNNDFICNIIRNDGFPLKQIKKKDHLQTILDNQQADALFLCNSHTTTSYTLNKPKNIDKIFSLDSNWLFNNKVYMQYKTYQWIDVIYCLFSRLYFERNLKANGGHYQIDNIFESKIYTPGFIPSGIRLSPIEKMKARLVFGLKDEDKLLVAYFGLSEFHSPVFARWSSNVINNVNKIIKTMNFSKVCKIHFINLSDIETIKHYKINNAASFNKIIGIADLVIMHHGYGTLPKIFNNQIPAICFSTLPEEVEHCPYYELKPAIELGAIKHLFFENYREYDLRSLIIKLLFDKEMINKIRQNQRNIFIAGEDNLIDHFYTQFSCLS
jgi:hypothetical protein